MISRATVRLSVRRPGRNPLSRKRLTPSPAIPPERLSLYGYRQIDDFFALQAADHSCDLRSGHRLVAELQAENAPRRAVGDLRLPRIEKRRDIRDARIGI